MAKFLDYFGAIGSPALGVASTLAVNAQNQSIMNKQMRWQEEMVRQSNEYNSPAAQRSRNIRAGVAPSFSPQGAAGVQSVTSPSMSAPDFSGFSNSAASLRQSALQDEEIKRSRLESYRAGVDTQLYLTEKIAKLANDIADLESKGLSNKESRLRYDRLQSEYNTYLDTLDDYKAIMHGQAEQLRLGNVEIEHSTERQDKESLARIKHMSVQEQIDWFEAKTRRSVGESQIVLNDYQRKQVYAMTRKVINDIRLFKEKEPSEVNLSNLAVENMKWSVEERKAAAFATILQTDLLEQKSNAPVAYVLRVVFGLESKDMLSVLNMLGVGAAAKTIATKAAKVNPTEFNPVKFGKDSRMYQNQAGDYRVNMSYEDFQKFYYGD